MKYFVPLVGLFALIAADAKAADHLAPVAPNPSKFEQLYNEIEDYVLMSGHTADVTIFVRIPEGVAGLKRSDGHAKLFLVRSPEVLLNYAEIEYDRRYEPDGSRQFEAFHAERMKDSPEDWHNIEAEYREVPVDAALADALEEIWRVMLDGARPVTRAEVEELHPVVDGYSSFSDADTSYEFSDGRRTAGVSSLDARGRVAELVQLMNAMMEACEHQGGDNLKNLEQQAYTLQNAMLKR